MSNISIYRKFFKRLFDIFFAIIFIIFVSPLYIFVTVMIWLQDRHNPFYLPIRVGKNKQEFRFYKFRTMIPNAEKLVQEDPELFKHMRSGTNKMKNDPRVTKIGKFLRKYSIYEFPQMLNVLKGDMSVIGPRALMPDEMRLYEEKSSENAEKIKTLVTVKPGITGYWQVNGRSKIDFDKRMDMDCFYAENISFPFDLRILLKTPFALIKGEGAY